MSSSSQSKKAKSASSSQSSRGERFQKKQNAPKKSSKPSLNKPATVTFSKDGCRIIHREYLQEISGSVAFALSQLSINPGLAGTFPWLSAIALRYESYHFNRLDFVYSRETTEFLTSGKAMLAVDYDASDPAPTNKVEIMSYDESISAVPCESFVHRCKSINLNRQKSHFVRGGTVPSGSDVKLYDVGNLFVATQGQPNTNTQGELYVDYDVSFITPQLSSISGLVSAKIVPVAPTIAAPCGTSFNITGTSPLIWNSATTLIAITAGQFLLETVEADTGMAISAGTVVSSGTYANDINVLSLLADKWVDTTLLNLNVGDIVTIAAVGVSITSAYFRVSPYAYSNL